MHRRRRTRLTNAFSKKLDNFKAAVALNFCYYNFMKTDGASRCTPAMAAGVEQSHSTVAELVERWWKSRWLNPLTRLDVRLLMADLNQNRHKTGGQ